MFNLKRLIVISSLILTFSISSAAFAGNNTPGSFLEQSQKIAEVLAPNSGTLLGVYLLAGGKLALVNEHTGMLHSYVLLPEPKSSNWLPVSFLTHLGFTLPTATN